MGGWSSGYGLTLKGFEGGGSRFESCNEKRLGKKYFILLAHDH